MLLVGLFMLKLSHSAAFLLLLSDADTAEKLLELTHNSSLVIMSGSIQDLLSVKELREWLVGRVADDDDIVIDDLQEDYNEQFEQEDESESD